VTTTGFRLSRLVVVGPNVPVAEIQFESGFNVLTGPSNSGKSYIVECIDFMLGSESAPGEDVEESKGYDTVFLELTTYAGKVFTLERPLLGGDLNLYESPYEDRSTITPRILAIETQTKKSETLSSFLLNLIGAKDVKVRRNANGEIGNLTFRMISHLFVVDETSIIAKKHSPVRLLTGFAKTPSERAFNYLLTGEDDHLIIALPNPKERRAQVQGKKELYDELIAALEKRIDGVVVEDICLQLARIEDAVAAATKSLGAKTEAIHQFQVERQTAFERQHTSESRLIVISELLARFNVLKQHYASDLERLEFISEGDFYFGQLVAVNCPMCGAPLEDHTIHKLTSHAPRLIGVQDACRAEGDKIRAHLADLEQTITGLADERKSAETVSKKSRAEISRVDTLLADELRPTFENEKLQVEQIVERRKELVAVESAFASLQQYRQARATLDEKHKMKKNAFAGLSVSAARLLSGVIQDLLRDWKFINASQVVEFNDRHMDIVVAGKRRQSNGKGLRGFIHGAFTLGLMRYCRSNELPHPGFIVLDSPITSYREGKVQEAEDEAAPEVQAAFWDSLAALPKGEQVIIVENKEPTESARLLAHYVHFYGEKSNEGRKGFFPLRTPGRANNLV
jgi:hypothetical protein